MRRRRFTDRLTAWIAALAIAFATLAPAVSHALATTQGVFASEFCTTQRTKPVPAPQGDELPASSVTQHCVFCAHAPAFGPLQSTAGFVAVATRDAPTVLLRSCARTPAPWVSPQPRAPPASC